MRIVKAGANTTTNLGRQGENNVTKVLFDISPFIRDFGSGVAQLSVQLPDDAVTYPAVIQQDGDTASWIVGSEWLVTAGAGKCQLSWFVNDQMAKSETYYTRITASIGEGAETPDPYENWLADILAAGADAAGERMGAEAARDAAAKSAEDAAVSEAGAQKSEEAAAQSETNAKQSEATANQKAEDAAALAERVLAMYNELVSLRAEVLNTSEDVKYAASSVHSECLAVQNALNSTMSYAKSAQDAKLAALNSANSAKVSEDNAAKYAKEAKAAADSIK